MLSVTFILKLPVLFYFTISERFRAFADWLRVMVDESIDHENDEMMAQFVDLFLSRATSKKLYRKWTSKIFNLFFFFEKQMPTIFLSTIKNDVKMFRTL